MKMELYKLFYTVILVLLFHLPIASARHMDELRRTDIEFFTTAEAARIGEQVLAYQRATGGWPKNIDMCRYHSDEELDEVIRQKERMDDSTTDNLATTTQIAFVARMFQATGDNRYQDSFNKGLEYLLSGQYDNGGWPQFWPNPQGYQIHITYNDGAMVNTLTILRDVAEQKSPYNGALVDETMCRRVQLSFEKGIECILATQIRVDGEPTVWCQQHDRYTYLPAPARSYELPSFCSQESVQIVNLLMSLPDPDNRVKAAVHGAMKWFDSNKLMGYRLERTGEPKTPEADTRLVADSKAGPIWGRFYDLDKCEIYVCDRDGVPRKSLDEIGKERRNGYSWYNSYPAELYSIYNDWAEKYDPLGKVELDDVE